MAIKAKKMSASEVPERGKLYEVKTSCNILVEEEQQSGSLDHAILTYCIENDEVGYFAKEYLPPDVPKDGAKRIDITAVMMNHAQKNVRWHLYDIKDTLAGEKTIVTLFNQWNSGLQYLQQNVLCHVSEYTYIPDLGVITRCYDEDRMKRLRNKFQGICDEIEKDQQVLTLAQQKKRTDIAKCRGVLKVAQSILDRKFQREIGEDIYEIHIRYLSVDETGFIYRMKFLV